MEYLWDGVVVEYRGGGIVLEYLGDVIVKYLKGVDVVVEYLERTLLRNISWAF